MSHTADLGEITIVLHRPRYPENIGAAARAMQNMGFERLAVVDPADFDLNRVQRMATHAASDLVKSISVHESLKDALASFEYVVGTTARIGGQRQTIKSMAGIARELVSIAGENRIAIVFGPEDRGLTNEDLRLCHRLVTIPTATFSSLNLGQAVMIVCYELHRTALDPVSESVPRMASRHELDGMYDQLRDVLVRISYLNPENPDYWMNKIRHFSTRMQLRAREVSIIRGICRQVNWYGEKRYRDGLQELETFGPDTDRLQNRSAATKDPGNK